METDTWVPPVALARVSLHNHLHDIVYYVYVGVSTLASVVSIQIHCFMTLWDLNSLMYCSGVCVCVCVLAICRLLEGGGSS